MGGAAAFLPNCTLSCFYRGKGAGIIEGYLVGIERKGDKTDLWIYSAGQLVKCAPTHVTSCTPTTQEERRRPGSAAVQAGNAWHEHLEAKAAAASAEKKKPAASGRARRPRGRGKRSRSSSDESAESDDSNSSEPESEEEPPQPSKRGKRAPKGKAQSVPASAASARAARGVSARHAAPAAAASAAASPVAAAAPVAAAPPAAAAALVPAAHAAVPVAAAVAAYPCRTPHIAPSMQQAGYSHSNGSDSFPDTTDAVDAAPIVEPVRKGREQKQRSGGRSPAATRHRHLLLVDGEDGDVSPEHRPRHPQYLPVKRSHWRGGPPRASAAPYPPHDSYMYPVPYYPPPALYPYYHPPPPYFRHLPYAYGMLPDPRYAPPAHPEYSHPGREKTWTFTFRD